MPKKKKSKSVAEEYVENPLDFVSEDDQEEFSQLILEKISYKVQADEAKEELERINSRLAYLMINYGVEKFAHGDLRFYVLRSFNVTISQDLLLKNGVAADVIERCKARKPYTTVSVATAKG